MRNPSRRLNRFHIPSVREIRVATQRGMRTFTPEIRLFFLFSLTITIGFGVFGLAFNLYLVELGLREDFIGVFNAVHTVAIAAGAISIGATLRRIGVWRALAGGAIGALVLQLGLALAEQPALILTFGALYGLAIAYLTTTTMPFIIEFGRPTARARTASVAFALAATAATIGSLMGGYIPELIGAISGSGPESVAAYRTALISGSVVGIAGLVPLFRMTEARRRRPGTTARAAAAGELPEDRRQVRKDVTVYVALGGILALGIGTVIPFYAVFLTLNGVSPGSVGFIYALGNLMGAAASLAGPALIQRHGNLRVNFAVRAILVPAYILLMLFPATWVVVFAHFVRAVSLNMGGPLDSTFIADIIPQRLQATAIGYRAASWNLCWAGSSIAGGWIIVEFGYDWTFAALAASAAIASGLFFTYFSRHPAVRAGRVLIALPQRQRAAIVARLADEAAREAAPAERRIAAEEARDLVADPENVAGHRTTSTTVDLDGHLADELGVTLPGGDGTPRPAPTGTPGAASAPDRA